MERLDKILSSSGLLSRSETERYVRKKRIKVDGRVALSSGEKVGENAVIEIDDSPVERYRKVLLMMNKPQGYVTTTSEKEGRNVMDILPEEYRLLSLKPVGRLDKGTTGLLLFTNDGDLLHTLISPKRVIEKEYLVTHKGTLTDEIINEFASGFILPDGTKCRSAVLRRISDGVCSLILHEGKYHQVKRMMGSRGLEVTALERIRVGSLSLSGLKRGEVRVVKVEQLFD